MNRRYGRFRISTELLRENPQAVQAVMCQVIVTRAEHLYHSHEIEYMAMSEHFDVAPLGEKIPWYLASVTKEGEEGEEEYKVEFRRI